MMDQLAQNLKKKLAFITAATQAETPSKGSLKYDHSVLNNQNKNLLQKWQDDQIIDIEELRKERETLASFESLPNDPGSEQRRKLQCEQLKVSIDDRANDIKIRKYAISEMGKYLSSQPFQS